MIELKCFCDGGYDNVTKTNNGYGSFRIYSETEDVLIRREYTNIQSSNEAEYQTLNELLGYLLGNFPSNIDVEIFADSKLMVNQVNNVWGINALNLKAMHSVTKTLLKGFDSISIKWVPRKIIVKQLGH